MRFPPASYLALWLCLPAAHVVAQGVQVGSTPYPTVTDERLQHPDAGDWLMYRRTYDGSGFSPLRQITASNVGKLSLAWSLNTDLVEAHETTPIVNHGRMFITTPGNNVMALDAATGKEAWTVQIDDYKTGCYATLAPLAVRGKILVGYSGGEFGVRGSLSAFDAETGKRIWRTYTVPAPDEPGGATWTGDAYKRSEERRVGRA